MNTNRFNAGQGFGYDKTGNVTSNVDPITSQARTFLFNGDNKQYEVKDANGTTTARYYYDGEGKRVKKKNEITDETTIFVYSSGKLVAEYSTVTPPANPTVNYTTTDHLGSPRVITNAIGHVTSRRDFLPFGEEVTINVGARSTALKYGSSDDKIRQKFTGYQKDTETSLDFAEARMYDNRFGRFTAVDPLLASGKSASPQTFNRYVYTSNNPIMRVDRNGKEWYMVKTHVLGYNNRHTYVWTPVWHSRTTYGLQKWNRGQVFYIQKGQYKGMWGTLDPYGNRWTVSDSRAGAEEKLAYYRDRMRQDLIGSAALALADSADSLINPLLRPIVGSPARETVTSALSAAGINPDESSEVGSTAYRTTTATEITLSSLLPNLLSGRGVPVAAVDETEAAITKTLHRPYIRKSTREAVLDAAPRNDDGALLDANHFGIIPDGKYHLGHKYGKEFWRLRQNAQKRGMTQAEFNDLLNDPNLYQIEDPISNMSHMYEMP